MKFMECISLVSFVLGGVSLIIGAFFSFSFEPGINVNPYDVFEYGAVLLIFFWTIAIGVASYSKYSH